MPLPPQPGRPQANTCRSRWNGEPSSGQYTCTTSASGCAQRPHRGPGAVTAGRASWGRSRYSVPGTQPRSLPRDPLPTRDAAPRAPPRPRGHAHRDAAQLASGPGGGPLGAALDRRVSESQQHRLPDSRHDNHVTARDTVAQRARSLRTRAARTAPPQGRRGLPIG